LVISAAPTNRNPANAAALLALALALTAGCGKASPPGTATATPLVIFAAASLTDVVTSLEQKYRAEIASPPWNVSLGSSSGLARQIQAGAPARLFLSADETWANTVAEKLPRAEVTTVLGNRLVLIVPAGSPFKELTLESLTDDRITRIALANPEGVPAGRISKQALQHAGVWDKLQAKLVPGDDVRQARAYVERGEADAGFVYATDAPAANSRIRIAAAIDESLHDPIRYGFVLLDRDDTDAAALFHWLQSDQARTCFEAGGFVVRPNGK